MIDNAGVLCKASDTGSDGNSLQSCASVRWCCVYTKPQGERAADLALRDQGFETYLPLYLKVRPDRSRVIQPLFPRYTFVRLDVDRDPWRAVVRSRAHSEVGQLILNPATRRPVSVPDAAIEKLLGQCDANRVIYPGSEREMRRGDRGTVLHGPLAQFSGICSRTSRDRVWLLLSIMGRQSEASFERGAVEISA